MTGPCPEHPNVLKTGYARGGFICCHKKEKKKRKREYHTWCFMGYHTPFPLRQIVLEGIFILLFWQGYLDQYNV